MEKGYRVENETIIIEREETDLDLFVKDFLDILKKHSDYLIVSGFVSISTGRTRGTEDVDILVPVMDKDKFAKLFEDLVEGDFWCYQGDTSKNIFEYIENLNCIRFAKKNELFPNMEFISINESKKAKFFEFSNPQKIRINKFEFKIPPIEFEILYKEILLGGEKDIADAKHLRTFFSDILEEDKFERYKKIILEEKNEWFRLCGILRKKSKKK